jgi:formylmethanofuran dehydrogenase subunit A
MWLSVKTINWETLLFKNATVWTNEKEGILEETDVLVKNGKFLLGKNISDASATVVDAKESI